MFQSTHPRGVRHQRFCKRVVLGRFQSTHPRGVRLRRKRAGTREALFQSTHPRGVRHSINSVIVLDNGFNPRTRVGCDVVRNASRGPLRGFNPRTRVGCDVKVVLFSIMTAICFNPRTRVGCDKLAAKESGKCFWFQSTHPRGVRRYLWKACYFGAFHRYLREPVLFEDGLPANFLPVFFFPYFSTRWLCGHLVWEKVVNWRFPNGILPVFPSFFPFLQNTSGPSGSIAAFAPTCSSLFFQLAPRK